MKVMRVNLRVHRDCAHYKKITYLTVKRRILLITTLFTYSIILKTLYLITQLFICYCDEPIWAALRELRWQSLWAKTHFSTVQPWSHFLKRRVSQGSFERIGYKVVWNFMTKPKLVAIDIRCLFIWSNSVDCIMFACLLFCFDHSVLSVI